MSHGLPLGHKVVCVCITTYKWESEVTSLKMPSGSSEISLPWRDLREEEDDKKRRKLMTMNLFQYWKNTALLCNYKKL